MPAEVCWQCLRSSPDNYASPIEVALAKDGNKAEDINMNESPSGGDSEASSGSDNSDESEDSPSSDGQSDLYPQLGLSLPSKVVGAGVSKGITLIC
jgi:hypothetical protein